jgi:cbb3-type cytochrome oxidase maturation protein
MDSIYILVPIALLFTAIGIKAFFWAVDNKQYDDLDAAAHSILFEEDVANNIEKSLDDKDIKSDSQKDTVKNIG